MALLWIDGGETWGTTTYASRAYLSGSNGTASPGRIAPGAYYINMTVPLITPSLGVQNTHVVGFGFYGSNASTTQRIRIAGLNGASEQWHLDLYENGAELEWRLYRGATLIDTSATFAKNIWHYFEIKVTSRTGTNGSYELRRNETTDISGTLVNLANTGGDGVDGFHFGSEQSGSNWRLDDMFILDSTGADNNDFKGDHVMFEVLPDGDGHQNDMARSAGATNYETIDDSGQVSPDSDYNSSDTVAHEDYYTFANLPGTGIGTIAGVKWTATARLISVGSRTLQPRYYNGSVEFDLGSDVTVDGTTFLVLPSVTGLNPDTGVAWTKSDLDAAEIGVEVST